LPLYAAAGRPERMHYWARRVLDELYSPDDLPGDEDNGEMSAWYVLMAIGLFPGCPGRPSYTLGSPLFPETRIALPGGKTLEIRAPAKSSADVYVAGVRWAGRAYSRLWIGHSDLAQGGRLEFAMADRPVRREIAPADLPESITPYGADAGVSPAIGLEIAINCGGSDFREYVGDCYYEGGTAVTVEPSGSCGPAGIGASAREGDFQYRIPVPMPAPGRFYTVRLRFASGGRQAVSINSKPAFGIVDTEGGVEVVREQSGVLPVANGTIEIGVRGVPGANRGGRLAAIVVVEQD
jgi:hypothetical protein